MLRIKLVKSPIGNVPRNRATVAALGLRKMNQTVEHADSAMIRGMVHKVKHMVTVEEVEGEPRSNLANRRKGTAVPAPSKTVKAAKAKAEKPKAEKPSEDVVAEAKPKRTTKKAKAEEEK
jgi:large subunit ribosomal protein L30